MPRLALHYDIQVTHPRPSFWPPSVTCVNAFRLLKAADSHFHCWGPGGPCGWKWYKHHCLVIKILTWLRLITVLWNKFSFLFVSFMCLDSPPCWTYLESLTEEGTSEGSLSCEGAPRSFYMFVLLAPSLMNLELFSILAVVHHKDTGCFLGPKIKRWFKSCTIGTGNRCRNAKQNLTHTTLFMVTLWNQFPRSSNARLLLVIIQVVCRDLSHLDFSGYAADPE